MKSKIIWSIGVFMALFSPILTHAEILYVSFDSSSATSTGLGPNSGNNPKYRIIGSFVASHDIDFNTGTTSMAWEESNSTGGVNQDVWFSTSTDSMYPTTGPGSVFNPFLSPVNIALASDGLLHSYNVEYGPQCGPGVCTVHTGETVYVLFFSSQGFPFATQFITSDTPQTSFFGEIAFNETIPPFTAPTKILAAVPGNGTTVASSTAGTVGAKISINTREYTQALAQNAGNWFVRLTLTPPIVPNVLGGAFASGASRSFTFPITTSGTTNFATTTDLSTLGDYSENIQIVQPSWASTYLSWFGFSGTVLDATTTRFTIARQSGFDKLNASSTSIIDQFLASSSPQLIASCASYTSFDLGDCLNLLFIPQPSTFSYVLADVNGILQFAPWGYATRAISILGGTATSSFPLIAVGIPDPQNIHSYMMFHFDPNEMIAGAAALNNGIVDPVSGQPVIPGIKQIVDTVIALSVITFIFYDLVGGKKSGMVHKTKLS